MPRQQIAYRASVDVQGVIKVLDLGDRSSRILVQLSPGLHATRMEWSPQRDQIAFVVWKSASNTYSVWVANADGSQPRELAQEAVLGGSPAWSFDGRKLVYRAYNPNSGKYPSQYEIPYALDVATGQKTRLGPSAGVCAWSPTDDRLAIALDAGQDTNNDGIYVMAGDGTEKTKIADRELASLLSWSPDGQRIALVRITARSLVQGVAIIDLRSGQQTWATKSASYSIRTLSSLLWSPDGRYLAFMAGDVQPAPSAERFNVLYVLEVCSQRERVLLSAGIGNFQYLQWSPDGHYIAGIGKLEGADQRDPQIYIVSVETEQVTQLTDTNEFKEWLDW